MRDKQRQIEGMLDKLYRQAARTGTTEKPSKPEPQRTGGGGGGKPADLHLDDMISRVFSGSEREVMQERLDRGRREARAERRRVRVARASSSSGSEEAPPSIAEADTGPTSAADEATPTTSPSGGPRILLDYVIPPPHTLQTSRGRYVETFRWFDRAFLVYDPSIPEGEAGSESRPWFGLAGPKFRCYYPNSSDADFEGIMTSGSSGRWLHAWPQRSNYIYF